jgi:hypothetical protein
VLITYAVKWALEAAANAHGSFNLPGLVQFIVMYLIAENMLRYYDTPMFGSGSTFSSFLPDAMKTYANWIDISRMDMTLQNIDTVLANIQRPQIFNIALALPYVFVEMDMWLLSGVLFAVTAVGFAALAIGQLVGPLFIPFFIVPRLSWLFWDWIQYMIKYSLYRVVSAGLLYISCTFLDAFFTHAMAGDFSLFNMARLIPAMISVTLACLWMIFKVTSISSDLTSGASTGGMGFIGGMAALARGAFA